MELTYQCERDDYWAYYQLVTRRLPPWKRFDFIPVFALSVLIAYDHWKPNTPGGLLFAAASGIAFFSMLIVVQLWREKEAFLKVTELRPGTIGLHTILLHSKGLDLHGSVMETRVRWAKVTELKQNDKLLVFFISQRFGFIVPKHAFQTPEQAQAFVGTAQAYRKSALDGTPAVLPSIPETWPPAPQRIV